MEVRSSPTRVEIVLGPTMATLIVPPDAVGLTVKGMCRSTPVLPAKPVAAKMLIASLTWPKASVAEKAKRLVWNEDQIVFERVISVG